MGDRGMTRVVRVDPGRPLAEQPGVGHNRWHPWLEPVLRVAAEETFTLETLDSSDAFLSATSVPADALAFPVDRVHPLTGPVHVEGAEPGMLLEVEIVDVEPRGPAISSLVPDEGLLGHLLEEPVLDVWELGADGYARTPALPRGRVPVRPFPGTIGVAPAADDLATFRALGVAPEAPEAAVPPWRPPACARSRPGRSAATSTYRRWFGAAGCTCRLRCPARCSRSATYTSRRAPASSARRRSRPPRR
jgi:formamidase